MAITGSGAISFSQINDELGLSSTATLDIEDAAENGFGLSKPHGMNEFFGLSLTRQQLTVKFLRQEEQGESNVFTGWISTAGSVASAKGELVLCAEAAIVPEDNRGSGISTVLLEDTTEFNVDGTVSNGDTIFEASSGTTTTDVKPGDDLVNQETFLVETTQNTLFQINTSGVISNVRSRTPNQPSQPTLNADSGTQITVTIPSTNTAVTREFKLQRSINGGSFSDRATFVPSDSGSIDDTSISTTFVDNSGISAGDVVKYQVRGQNAFDNSAFSPESATVTTPAGTSWGSISNFNLHIGSGQLGSQELESSEKQLTLTNGSGNTTISIEQPDNSNPPPDLEIKVGNATGNYNLISSYTESPSAIAAASTYFMKFKLSQAGTKLNSAEDCTISFTNNSVTRTFEINVEVASGGLGLCIHELMLVDTPMGQKSIYDLNLGDLVSSYNSELDIVENVPIQQIIKPMHKNLYKVNNLILTEDHPVFDIDGKLLSVSPELTKQRYELNAEKLEIGHTLKTLNNEELIVEKIRRYNGEFKTYTILTKNNNFFVDGILVHSEINH
tara:strand:+ start:1190 stop:2866 length:1677 start_codon:yes stop_codon:yes gene_type:complete